MSRFRTLVHSQKLHFNSSHSSFIDFANTEDQLCQCARRRLWTIGSAVGVVVSEFRTYGQVLLFIYNSLAICRTPTYKHPCSFSKVYSFIFVSAFANAHSFIHPFDHFFPSSRVCYVQRAICGNYVDFSTFGFFGHWIGISRWCNSLCPNSGRNDKSGNSNNTNNRNANKEPKSKFGIMKSQKKL